MIGYVLGMRKPSDMPRLTGFRFPREIIAFAVWAHHHLALSTADVEDLLAERRVILSRETIRLWVNRFGGHFAGCVTRDRPRAADKWHLDEGVVPIGDVKYWLWRAIDSNGDVSRPIPTKRQTDCALSPDADHRAHKGLNNRIEGSHRPTRRGEKIMGRFKSSREAQRFLIAHDQINTIFKPRRYRLSALSYRHARADAFSLWNDYIREMTA